MTDTTKDGFAPEWLESETQLGERWLCHGPLSQIKADMARLNRIMASGFSMSAPDETVPMEDRNIRDDVTVRIYRPAQPHGKVPIIVYFHGGGFVAGDLNSGNSHCRRVSMSLNVVSISVGYRLAPQYRYPAALNDGVDAVLWAKENAFSLGGDPNRIYISGSSAGGSLSIGVTLKLIDGGGESLIKGIAAIVPMVVHPDYAPSQSKDKFTAYVENAEKSGNTASAMRTFYEEYDAPKDDTYTYPLLHPRIGDLPKVYLVECGMDTVRDDARLFKEALDAVGVPNKYDAYPGFPHIFWSFPQPSLDGPRQRYQENLLKGLRFLLE